MCVISTLNGRLVISGFTEAVRADRGRRLKPLSVHGVDCIETHITDIYSANGWLDSPETSLWKSYKTTIRLFQLTFTEEWGIIENKTWKKVKNGHLGISFENPGSIHRDRANKDARQHKASFKLKFRALQIITSPYCNWSSLWVLGEPGDTAGSFSSSGMSIGRL